MSKKILVKFPTRGRPQRFLASLHTLYQLAYDTANLYVLVTADEDDPSMFDQGIFETLRDTGYPNLTIFFGTSKSKIEAVNRDFARIQHDFEAASDWDIVVLMSDDMRMTMQGWDEIIRVEMQRAAPDLDGYLNFKERDTKEVLNVMEIVGRKYFERFGYLYHPSYKSLWCDNESMAVAKKLGRYQYIDMEIFCHLNPAYGHLPRDTMFDIQQAYWDSDHQNFLHRQAINFGL